MHTDTRLIFSYSPEGRQQRDEWLENPLPVNGPFDVWLEFPASDVRVFASVEPILNKHAATGLSESPVQQFLLAYTIQHGDGHTVTRSAMWQFVKGSGLCMGAEELKYLFEVHRVSTQIIGALYEGIQIGELFPASPATVH